MHASRMYGDELGLDVQPHEGIIVPAQGRYVGMRLEGFFYVQICTCYSTGEAHTCRFFVLYWRNYLYKVVGDGHAIT